MKIEKTNSLRWLSLEDLEGEKWKDIPWANGLYSVSSYGRVKSKRSRKILKLWLSKFGYYNCKICINNKEYVKRVNRLVAELFIPNKYNLPCVNHKDENKENNFYENLEWCTHKYNTNYGTCQERRILSLAKTLKNKSKFIIQYTISGEFVAKYNGRSEILKSGLNYATIIRCCKRKINTSYGYVWRYDGDDFSYTPPKRNDDCCKKRVACVDMDGNIVSIYRGITDAAIAICGDKSKNAIISRCCKGGRPTAYGYKWRYV